MSTSRPVEVEGLTSSQAYDAELARWEHLIFADMDQNPNRSNANNNTTTNPQPGSAEDIQTAALLTQLAAAAFHAPSLDPAYAMAAQRQAASGSGYNLGSHQQQYVSPTSLAPQGYDPRMPHPLFHNTPLPSPQMQPYNPHPASEATRSTRSQGANMQAGPSASTSSPDADYADDDYEDKRRRNTAASARFRIKKKQRTLELERSVSDLTGRAEELEREAADLRRENGWLKEIVMLKGGRLAGLDLSGGMAYPGQSTERKSRDPGEADESDSEQSEGTDKGKGAKNKGKGKAKKK